MRRKQKLSDAKLSLAFAFATIEMEWKMQKRLQGIKGGFDMHRCPTEIHEYTQPPL